MSIKYKFNDPDGLYFISCATVGWIDLFTRRIYKDLFIESLEHCQTKKNLELYAWCLMSNHFHWIGRSSTGNMSAIMRDFKKFTSKKLIEVIITMRKRAGKNGC
jgi:REP element-mobilizing transposase RayT